MLIDLHSHTAEHSDCSLAAAGDLVQMACRKGLAGMVLTDHHYLWSMTELLSLRRRTRLPDSFLLCAGQEITNDSGDILVYGAETAISRGTPTTEIRRMFPAAALVWAHPWRNQQNPAPLQLCDPHLDAIEIFNSNQSADENCRGFQEWERLRFHAVGGSDSHTVASVASFPTIFKVPIDNIAQLASAIRQGLCSPVNPSR